MNRFRVNLHPAFFDKLDSYTSDGQKNDPGKTPEISTDNPSGKDQELLDAEQQKKEEERVVVEDTRKEEDKLENDIYESQKHQNNESMASSTTEIHIVDDKVLKEFIKLAKNKKKVDVAWTNNEWKCSRAEKKLAVSSAKVLFELISTSEGVNKIEQIKELCRKHSGPSLDEATAKEWKETLGISSKEKDIQNFYTSFKEYQNRATKFIHLQGFMGFCLETDIDDLNALKTKLEQGRSVKISKTEIRSKGEEMYEGKKKPKDWKERASFEIIKSRLNNSNNLVPQEKMLGLLCDFNLDGEVNTGDVGYKTGSQFAEIFRRELAMTKLQSNDAIKNLVAYASKMGLNMNGVTSIDTLYSWMTGDNGYENTRKLQNFIQNSPADFSDILANGEKAGKDTLDAVMRATALDSANDDILKAKLQTEIDNKVKETIEREKAKLEAMIPDQIERANIVQQLTNQLPTALLDKATNIQKGMAAGVRLPLDQIVKGMSTGFQIGIDSKGNPLFGLFFGWDTSIDLGKGADLNIGANAGLNLGFIPCVSVHGDIGKDIKEGRRNKTLVATGVGRISLSGNAGIYGGIIPVRGAGIGFENNKKKGIEKQAANIHNRLILQAQDWINKIYNMRDKGSALKELLKKEFEGTPDAELDKATDNLMKIIDTFPLDENTSDIDKTIYAKVIADVFTDMWRNNALIGITDNKWKISGGKIGIQFIAGFVPIPSLVMKFTKYRNARTVESDNSQARRVDAAVNGTGNKSIDLGESKEVGQPQVEALNDILKQYGVSKGLQYVQGTDGKPGRIKVPVSMGKKIDVRISATMKDCVINEGVIDGEHYYSFPANATYRLLAETGGNQKSAILNIGGEKNDETDALITKDTDMRTLEGNKELKEGRTFPDNGEFKVPENLSEFKNAPILDSLFKDPAVIDTIKKIDSADWKSFSGFMKTKVDAQNDIKKQITTLTAILEKNKLNNIANALKDVNTPITDKQLIIDRVLAISANVDVNNKTKLQDLIRRRGNRYRSPDMKGPNGRYIFGDISDKYRSELAGEINNFQPQIKGDILGATAFYNRNNKHKGLALTGLGVTSVLGGVVKELNEDDAKKAKERFLGGGESENGNRTSGALDSDKSPAERENLNKSVLAYIRNSGFNIVTTNTGNSNLMSDGELTNLLNGDEVEFQLDNGEKKVKIKLDTKYVFYLMGECANESVGMQLNGIQVQEQVEDYAKAKLLINNSDGTSVVNNTSSNAAVGVSISGGEKSDKVKSQRKDNGQKDDEYNNNDSGPAGNNNENRISGGGKENELRG